MFILLFAVLITLPLLQQQQHQQLTCFTPISLHVVLLTVLSLTLLFVEAADDSVTSDFLHKDLQFVLQGLLNGRIL